MRTRRSWRNQDRLWKILGGEQLKPQPKPSGLPKKIMRNRDVRKWLAEQEEKPKGKPHSHECPVCAGIWLCLDSPCAGRFRMCQACKMNKSEEHERETQ